MNRPQEVKHKNCERLGSCEVCSMPVCPDCGTTTDQGELLHYGECSREWRRSHESD